MFAIYRHGSEIWRLLIVCPCISTDDKIIYWRLQTMNAVIHRVFDFVVVSSLSNHCRQKSCGSAPLIMPYSERRWPGVIPVKGWLHKIDCLCDLYTVCSFLLVVSGKDALLEKLEGKDINSVAGVLKLYFRELKDPLFPFHMFDDLMACSSNCNFNSQWSRF